MNDTGIELEALDLLTRASYLHVHADKTLARAGRILAERYGLELTEELAAFQAACLRLGMATGAADAHLDREAAARRKAGK